MNGNYLSNAGVFLIDFVFGLYILAVVLRFLLQFVRADFYNPLAQAIVTITNPPLRPLRRAIPAFKSIDTSSVVLMLALQMIATLLIFLIQGFSVNPLGLIVIAIGELSGKVVYVFIFAIFIQVIASWIAPGTYNPVLALVDSLTAPIMRPMRRLIPPLGGLDLSPMIAILFLYLTLMLIVQPIKDAGRLLAA
ncbi:MAG: YggT family protein [Gammaproteobacteria bacterium]